MSQGCSFTYDGHNWTPVQLPASLGINKQVSMVFDNLAMVSPEEGWMAGTLYGGSPSQVGFILHYFNGQWTVQYRLDNAQLGSLSMLSASDGWATGSTATFTNTPANGMPTVAQTSHPLLLRYVQGKWTTATNLLSDPSAGAGQIQILSATDGWMTGQNISTWLHYNGKQWLPVTFPALKTLIVVNLSVQFLSATEGWAVGTQIINAQSVQTGHGTSYRSDDNVPLLLHFHDGAWSIFHSP